MCQGYCEKDLTEFKQRANFFPNLVSSSLCGQGSSVVVREKKRTLNVRNSGFGKKKKNPKPKYGPCNRNDVMEGCGTTYYDRTDVDVVEVRKENVRVRNRGRNKNNCRNCRDKTVLIQRNGRTAHVECEDQTCFIGGDLLVGDIGDECNVRADDCDRDLVCVSHLKAGRRNGSAVLGTCRSVEVSMTEVIVARNARGGYCNLDEGWDACDAGLFCLVEGVDGIALRSGRDGGRVGGCGRGAGYGGTNSESCDACPLLESSPSESPHRFTPSNLPQSLVLQGPSLRAPAAAPAAATLRLTWTVASSTRKPMRPTPTRRNATSNTRATTRSLARAARSPRASREARTAAAGCGPDPLGCEHARPAWGYAPPPSASDRRAHTTTSAAWGTTARDSARCSAGTPVESSFRARRALSTREIARAQPRRACAVSCRLLSSSFERRNLVYIYVQECAHYIKIGLP